MKPARSQLATLAQIVKLIPPYLVDKLARAHGCDAHARAFTPWSHVVALVFTQLTHAFGLNEVCDTLRLHSGVLTAARHAHPPSRNAFSNANMIRDPQMMEDLFWAMLDHLRHLNPSFGKRYSGVPRRFKKVNLHAMDSTTIPLIAKCMDWAKHRRNKAAVKLHLLLGLMSSLPDVAHVRTAKGHDSTEAARLCANLCPGDAVVFDKAYIDFEFLHSLTLRQVSWAGRAKDNMDYEVVRKHAAPKGRILRDVVIRLSGAKASKDYPDELRLVEAMVEMDDGRLVQMQFITNNFDWAASTVADVYKARWGIEVFFKEIKQTLKLGGFLGNSENAIKWQIWSALLTMLLLRFIAETGKWKYSYIRLISLIRGAMWECYDLFSLVASCGTGPGPPRLTRAVAGEYLPGFSP